jgi:ethanolamine-phosphate cytidylyltransferase
MNLPAFNMHERCLSVLGCRYVDDVLLDAPYVVTSDMIATLGIDEIVQVDNNEYDLHLSDLRVNDTSRYQVAIENGIYHSIQVSDPFRIENIIYQIKNNQSQYQAKYNRKQKAEQEYMMSIKDERRVPH